MKIISFEEAQSIRLEIMKELDRFCKTNGLNYFLAFGTLIGAVRHHGFIPWDDDMDILMPRPDWLKFLELYKLNGEYDIITNKDDKGLYYGFIRVGDGRTYSKLGKKQIMGVNVEIYPIDGCPNDTIEFEKFKQGLCKFRAIEKWGIRIANGLILRNLWPFKGFNPWFIRAFIKKYYEYGSQYNYYDSDYIIIAFANPYKYMRYPRSWFDKALEVDFCDAKFSIPCGYHQLLSSIYKDYMTPPPIEKQVPTHGFDYYI